jgi:hypothetical protein
VRTGAHGVLSLTPIWQCPYAWVGSYVYYSIGTTVEGVNLFRVPIEKDTWRIEGPGQRITSGAGMQYLASVLPDGLILYADLTWVASIFILEARPDQGLVSGPPVPVTKDVMAKFDPSLSRDGSKLAYVAFGGVQPPRREIRLTDLAGGGEKIFPMRSVSLAQTCRISPDGSVLSYGDIVEGKQKTFIATDRDAAGREVCEDCAILGFFADPNFAVLQVKQNALLRLNLTTGERATIVEAGDGKITEPAPSPDDRWVAFVLDKPEGGVAMCFAPLADGRPAPEKDWVRLFEEDSYLGSPAWSPDGGYLYYLSEREGSCAVWVQKLNPKSKRPEGATRTIFRPTQKGVQLNIPRGSGAVDVAANKIALWAGEMSGNIYLATPKPK